MEVKNDIKVLLKKHNDAVKVDDIGGELLIYDNTPQLAVTDSNYNSLLKDYAFSGVAVFGFSDQVKFELEDFYGKKVKFLLHKDFIYVIKSPSMDLVDPIAVVRFIPKSSDWSCEQFYAHFLTTTN